MPRAESQWRPAADPTGRWTLKHGDAISSDTALTKINSRSDVRQFLTGDARTEQLLQRSSGAVKIDHESPVFLVYTAVASAIALVIVYWLFNDGEIDWFMVVLLAAAAVVGVLIAGQIRRRRA